MRNRFYIPSSVSQRDDLPLWDLESLENETMKSSVVPASLFIQHCDLLAQDNNLGFKKEFDCIMSSSSNNGVSLGKNHNGAPSCSHSSFFKIGQ